jgi:hypothetical protein
MVFFCPNPVGIPFSAIGSIGLFIILAMAILASRKINWNRTKRVPVANEG